MVPPLILNDDTRSTGWFDVPSVEAVLYPNPCKNYFRIEAMMSESDKG